MVKKKQTKDQLSLIRKRRLVFVAALCLCVYLISNIISCRVSILKERTKLDSLNDELESRQLENDELERIINSDDNDEYIERIAREKLGYAGVDERVFVDLAGS